MRHRARCGAPDDKPFDGSRSAPPARCCQDWLDGTASYYAGSQPNNAVVIATINRRVMIGLLLVSDRSSTELRSHPSRYELTRIAATCSRLRRWPSAAAASVRGSLPHARLRRKAVGVSPVALRKAAVNELVSLKPIANPTSVTEDMGLANSVLASSIRRSL